MSIQIRTMQLADEPTIVDICYVTSPWGRNGKQELYQTVALRWAIHYVRHETEHCHVAVDTEEDNRVVGYLLCAPDTLRYDQEYETLTHPLLKANLKAVGGNNLVKRGKLQAEFGVFSHSKMGPKVKKLIEEFPAHIHIDIYPSHHRRGIGRMLFSAHEAHLKAIGCPGYHLGVGTNNENAVKFYTSLGMTDAIHQVGSIMFTKPIP
ncbi:MAG: GNAT family N-acetyltransferase [Anaerolineae bacterium]|jgi:ribosomal protein S18 acetylase RimI-like enzyme|nr:GNAT family N-acetyltransferase [Anaerolineae bacterium]